MADGANGSPSRACGAKLVADLVTDVILRKDLSVFLAIRQVYMAETVIIATGAQAKWLGLESEKKFQGYGVSGCATCDGFFYRNKKVAVVGGGNAAMEEALYLSGLASEVVMIHRRDEFRGEKILRERVAKNPKIKVMWDSVVDEIKGDEAPVRSVTGMVVHNVKTEEKTLVPVDGVFIAIGHAPSTSVFKGKLKMDEEGYLLTKPDSTATEVKGVFAAGDVKDKVYRQAVTAAGMGCMAALEAERLLASED